MTAAERKDYDFVPDQSFRLFNLRDVSASLSSPTCIHGGQLETFAIDDAPPFLALSYSWGTGTASVPLSCGGLSLRVTNSLANAIQALQGLCVVDESGNQPPVFPTTYVWIDQICINQKDSADRSCQVQQMGAIYSSAIQTIIWLGRDMTVLERRSAWGLVDTVYARFEEGNPGVTSFDQIDAEIYSDEMNAQYGLPPLTDESWQCFRTLVDLPWFSRTWCVQEAVLSRIDAAIVQGDDIYSFERLGWSASWLRRKGYVRLSMVSDMLLNIDTIANIRRSRASWSFDVLLASTVTKFEATEQRDKIYGLLGMAKETRGTNAFPEALKVDYTLDLGELHRRVTIYLMSTRQSLTCLTACISPSECLRRYRLLRIPPTQSTAPSWVPSWTDSAGEPPARFLVHITYSSAAPALQYPSQYRASKGLSLPLTSWRVSLNVLSTQALRVDSVLQAWPYVTPADNVPDIRNDNGMSPQETTSTVHTEDIIRHFWTLALGLTGKATEPEKSVRSFIRATTADQSRRVGIDPEQMCRNGAAYILRSLQRSHDSLIEVDTADDTSISLEDDATVTALRRLARGALKPRTFVSLAHYWLTKRSFFVTTGRRLGLGPLETKRGDAVYVVPGGDVPYIVSATDLDEGHRRNKLVGECYVEGLMIGEAIDAWREGVLHDEILNLS